MDAITAISGYYGIPVLDLFRVSGIQPSVPVLKERYIPDGLHPNDLGYERIAEKLLGFLRAL
ncbi:MAG: SGNH/GDSL hydrolase family protein [Faecousia sp.]